MGSTSRAMREVSFISAFTSGTRVGVLVFSSDAVISANDLAEDNPNMVIDLSEEWPRFGGRMSNQLSMREFLTCGDDAVAFAQEVVCGGAKEISLSDVQLLAPISNPEKLICIGLNYSDHAKECGMALPVSPVVFSKFNNAICGPTDEIVLPSSSSKIDYEVELVVVIGKQAKCVSEADAMDAVFGYTVGNDVSARDWQLERGGSQWLTGKTFDTFAPLGPAIVSKDEVVDVDQLAIKCFVNGIALQDGNTSYLHFKIPHIVSHLSHLMTLQPGDIIFTGTPPGVGLGRSPQVWLQPGDRVVCEIEGLGKISNLCVQ